MDMLIASAVFLCGIFLCMAMGWSLAIGLAFGLVCFTLAARRRGHSWRALAAMAGDGARTAMVVLRVLVFIGCLTGLWRASGTIAFFVYNGLKLITPNIFLLAAFLMATVMSLTFGSAFGVAGTAGVILSVIARTGGADLAMTAGAVVSGAYLGERLSPASSSSALAAALAGTDQNAMQRRMWRTTPLPLALSLIVYGVLSVLFPIRQVDPAILNALRESFDLSWWTVIPAVILLALPFFRVKAVWAILISCGVSVVIAVLLQGVGWLEALQISVFGCELDHPELSAILSGGGVVSMVNGMFIVFFSCTSSGILKGAGLLDPVKEKLEHLTERTDLFFTTALVSLASAALLCNQSIALVLTEQMVGDAYRRRGQGGVDLAHALGNTAIPLPAMIPWSIAVSMPLAVMEAPSPSIPFACFLYLCPLCDWLFWRKRERKNMTES